MAMGFASVVDLFAEGHRISHRTLSRSQLPLIGTEPTDTPAARALADRVRSRAAVHEGGDGRTMS